MDVLIRVGLVVTLHFIFLTCTVVPLCTRETTFYNITNLGDISCVTAISLSNYSDSSVAWRLEGEVLNTTTNDLDLSTVNTISPGFKMFQCDFNYSITDNGTITNNSIPCKVNVTINSHPAVTISPQTISMAILYPNSALEIECTGSGFPSPSVRWELDSIQISSNGTLNFSSNEAKIGNNQKFDCIGTNSIGMNIRSITITVQAMPPIVTLSPSSPTTVFIGNSTTFNCTAMSNLTTAQPSITWLLNGSDISQTGEVYIINQVSTSNSGTYSCRASILNSEIATSNSVELVVNSPPPLVTITTNETDNILTANQSIVLTCNVTPLPFEDNLTVFIDWTFPNTNTRPPPFNSNSQTLTNLQLTDRGNYTCSARVGNSNATNFTISLDIVPLAPVITVTRDNPNPLIGSRVMLSCNIVSISNVPPNITWYFNSTDIIPNESNETLVLSPVTLNDTGMYSCSATIEGSEPGNSTPVSIEVYQKPQNLVFSISPEKIIERNDDRVILCTAIGVPDPSIVWSDQFNRNYANPLKLSELNNTDTGIFTCIATSAAGSDSESIFITIVPVAPTLNIATSEPNPVLNRTFTLICNVTSRLPFGNDISNFTFNWTLQGSTDILFTSQNYTFIAADSTNGSVYQCSATVAGSGEGMAVREALMLQSEPRITNFSLSNPVYVGLEYEVVCEAEGVPTPIVTLSTQGPMRNLNPPYKFSEDSTGQREYTCSAENIHRTTSETKSVIVKTPEINTELKSNVSTIVEGGAFQITCSVTSTVPEIPLIDTSYVISDNVTMVDHLVMMSPDNKTATVDIVSDDIETPETVYLFSCTVYIQGETINKSSTDLIVRITDSLPIITFPIVYVYIISAIVVILFIILLVLVIITFVCCCVKGKRRHRDIVPKNTKNYVELDTPIAAPTGFSFPILVSKFSETYEMLLEDNQQRLKEQYSHLATIKAVADEARKSVNTTKNRYPDVLAYDHSRVILSKVQGTDYINANFMDGFRPEGRYIAAQGPLGPPKLQTAPAVNGSAPELNTVADFWRMIWEHNVTTVVMLTNLIENNRIKCALYWPVDSRNYGRIRVSLTEESQFCDYVIRKFLVERIQVRSSTNAARQITQFHFTSWPDHGVPLFPISMIQFVKRVRSHINQTGEQDNAPNLIHCSAGVGRTGTFICLDILLQQLAETAHTIDIWAETSKLRHNRNHMIQEYLQYEFVHQAINEHIHFGDTECSAADFPKMISFLNEVTDENPYKIGMSRLEVEFKKLHMKVMSNQHKNAMRSENSGKNRFINTMPFDNNCVKLQPIPGVTGSDYINASYIDSDKTHRAFIATQGPLKSTMEDFWRMIIDIGSNVIVMLTENTEDKTEDYFSFSHIHHGPFHIQTLKKHMHNDYVHRELLIRIDDKQETYTVHHFQLTKLLAPVHSMKDCAKGLLSLITGITMTLHSDEEHEKKVPKVVHCGTGNGMTGVFITACIILQRLEYEDRIDVFNTVKRLRMQRVAMVQTVDQYDLCYRTVMEYLQSSS